VIMNERRKEIIKYHTELLSAVFVIFFADVTGIISLIKKGSLTVSEWNLIFAGLLSIFVLSIVILNLDRRIKSEIKSLE
jgi:hypothetical protein